jgi:lipopolysaccharide/colanic/teichoic acid biosynthesis glycosyltransferase
VLAALPVLLPLIAVIALAVRLTSRGPVLFLQKRVGLNARPFTIIKFRTMIHSDVIDKGSITTADNRQITYVGRILRHWKMDELPQLFNVLRADMSLVGPRPKVPEQQVGYLRCRPGVTGAASIAFAREEVLLAHIPKQHLDTYYHDIVLPFKQQLDDAYMARATFMSDLQLILKTILRQWNSNGLQLSTDRPRIAWCGKSRGGSDGSEAESMVLKLEDDNAHSRKAYVIPELGETCKDRQMPAARRRA